MDGRILTLFAVAGGALGMLLALMLFTGNHMNKRNIAWSLARGGPWRYRWDARRPP